VVRDALVCGGLGGSCHGLGRTQVTSHSLIADLVNDELHGLARSVRVKVDRFVDGFILLFEPHIVQVKEGAAWAAFEYMRFARDEAMDGANLNGLLVVPAGITYTDKTQYLSRVSGLSLRERRCYSIFFGIEYWHDEASISEAPARN